jgi:hypothetical protein
LATLWQTIFELDKKDGLAYLHPVSCLSKAFFLIAYAGNIPEGIGHIYIDEKGVACLSSFGVLQGYRRKEIGTAVRKMCINTAVKEGAH